MIEDTSALWGPKTVSPHVSWAYLDVAARPV